MDGNGNDTIWSMVQYSAGLALGGVGAAVAYLWRQMGKIDSVSNRVDVLTDAVDDLVQRQETIEHEQGDQRVLLAEVRNDVKWIRDTMEQNHRK